MLHAEVLRVLDRLGIECQHPRTLAAAAATPGVRVDHGRVCFKPDFVDELVAIARRENAGEPLGDEITITGPWNCLNIADMDTGAVRPSTGADVRQMFKLVHAARAGHICPVYPHDVPPPLQILSLEKAGLELTETDGSQMEFADAETLEYAVRMFQAAGRRYHLEVQFLISPLRANPLGLEQLWTYKDRADMRLTAAAAPIPQAGLTAPLFMPGGLVQAAAEALGAYALTRIIGQGKIPCHPQFRLDLFDMRDLTTVYSSPDHILVQLLLKDVYAFYYGRPKPGHFLQCNARSCDAQAILERTAYLLTLAFAGERRFCLGAGQLCMDEIFSPALFVIDQEIARFLTHIVRGIGWDEREGLSFDTIAEVGRGGEFLSHPTTLETFRGLFSSGLFRRMGVSKWRAAGEPSVEKLAIARAKELIASHNFALPPKVQAEVNRIYAQAERRAARKR
ncbi:MAG: trimethylamine methyltransferase family protein [Planctomycetota bacterium]|nr:trimethylamine methyltransferase family protein [Planctomycetota bacterium]